MTPLSIDETAEFNSAPRPEVRVDLIVVDGGPLHFGSNLTTGAPANMVCETPVVFRSVPVGSAMIVAALRSLVGRGVAVGKITRGEQGMRPWLLAQLDSGSPERQAAAGVYARVLDARTWVNPVPRPIHAQPPAYTPPPPPPTLAHAQYPMPAGWDPARWATFTDEVKASILAASPPPF